MSLVVAVVLPASPVLAATNPFGSVDCTKAPDSAVCQPTTGDPISGSNGVLHKVTLLIAVLAGAAAIIVMILAGIRYITSNGDAEQVAKAKRTIILAAAGLVIIVAGQAIINIVLSRV